MLKSLIKNDFNSHMIFHRDQNGDWHQKEGLTIRQIKNLSYSEENQLFVTAHTYERLSLWAQDRNCSEIWLFAKGRLFEHLETIIIHAMKIKDDHDSFIAQLSIAPTRGDCYSYIQIDRRNKSIMFTHTDGTDHDEILPTFTQDEKKSLIYTMEGRTINEISKICCWSESKSKKIRNSLLDKFHADNIVQLVKINDIFGILRYEDAQLY